MTTWNEQRIRKRPTPRAGFSLIELTAVLVILAVLAGVVSISVRSHVARARLNAACDLIQACDSHARHAARAHDSVAAMRIHADSSRIVLPDGRTRRIARGIHIDRLWTHNASARRGTLQVVMTPTGQSDSYALRLKPSVGAGRWLVVLGGSGQILQLDDERQVRRLLAIR